MDRKVTYKFQANADYKKALRSRAIDVKRKQQRCDVMMNNRRLPLEEKNQVTEVAPVANKGSYKKCKSQSEPRLYPS